MVISAYGDFPRKVGRKGSAKGSVASFAKTWFDGSVGEWSPKKKHQPGFLIACLAFSESVSCSVTPQVVGSSPTRGAKKDTTQSGGVFFGHH